MLAFGKLIAAFSILALGTAGAPGRGQQRFPEGKGLASLEAKCLSCHEADLITQQRLSRAGWTREVDKMIRWGTELSESEKQESIEYLSAHFGPRPVNAKRADQSAEARGLAIFNAKCLSCHEADLTEQQRLTRAGWVREVDKMIRWGADVSESEKSVLVDYLSERYGTTR